MTIMENDGTLPLYYPLVLRAHGDTFRLDFQLLNDDDPYDLTGCTALSEIRYAPAVSQVLMQPTVTIDPDQVTLNTKGLLHFVVEPVAYGRVPRFPELTEFGTWDLQITWPSGDVITYLEGPVSLKGDSSHG